MDLCMSFITVLLTELWHKNFKSFRWLEQFMLMIKLSSFHDLNLNLKDMTCTLCQVSWSCTMALLEVQKCTFTDTIEALKSHLPWCSTPGLISATPNTISSCVWSNLTHYAMFEHLDNEIWELQQQITFEVKHHICMEKSSR